MAQANDLLNQTQPSAVLGIGVEALLSATIGGPALAQPFAPPPVAVAYPMRRPFARNLVQEVQRHVGDE
jgi:hypothetical protein